MANFYGLGYALADALTQPVSFMPFEFAGKRKRCDRGYSCGATCINTKKKCKIALNGDAKTFAEYVKKNKDRLTLAQSNKAKEQNIGLKAGKTIKQEKQLIKNIKSGTSEIKWPTDKGKNPMRLKIGAEQ